MFAACAAVASTTIPVAHADYQPPTELMGDGGPVRPLKDAAMIERTEGGLRYIAGQQDSHLTVTVTNGKVRYVDTGTAELREIPSFCRRESVTTGIAALCTIPAAFDQGTMFLEVWPRLGDDFVDGSTLSSRFRFWVLADAGFDTVRAGDGDDFVNGAQDNDRAWGGAGDDWIRTGIGRDRIWGEAGEDKLVGADQNDVIRGGDGNDQVGGGAGDDSLWADAGTDTVRCGSGNDDAHLDGADHEVDCESVSTS
jgi:hypothetical protein